MSKGQTVARPPKPRAVRDELLDNLRAGLTIKTAAEQAGITERTYYRWLEESGEAGEWSLEVQAASSYAQAVIQKKLEAAAEDKREWRAYAWILERRWPEEWGAKREMEVSVSSSTVQDAGDELVKGMIAQLSLKYISSESESESDEPRED